MKYIKSIRIFLLILIIIGIGLLSAQKMWVPKVVEIILKNENKGQQETPGPIGISFTNGCEVVGSKGNIDPSVISPNYSAGYVLGDNEWLIDCGNSRNSNARGTLGPILEQQGWKFCDAVTATGSWWKNNTITTVVESAGPGYPFRIVQDKGADCSQNETKITLGSPLKNSVLKEGANTTIQWNIMNPPLDKSNWSVVGSVRCEPSECGKTGLEIFSYPLPSSANQTNWRVASPAEVNKFRGPNKADYRNYGLDSKNISSLIVVCLVKNEEVYSMGFLGGDGVHCSDALPVTVIFDPPLSF